MKKLRPALEKAAHFIEIARNPDAAWRYGIRPGDNDTSVTYWMIAALDRVRALGIPVDPKAFDGARAWLDTVTDPEFFRAGYTARGSGSARRPGKLELTVLRLETVATTLDFFLGPREDLDEYLTSRERAESAARWVQELLSRPLEAEGEMHPALLSM